MPVKERSWHLGEAAGVADQGGQGRSDDRGDAGQCARQPARIDLTACLSRAGQGHHSRISHL